MADVIDDDTLAAVATLWGQSSALAAILPAPHFGRLRSLQGTPLALPYAQAESALARREPSGTGGAFHDYRKVTITIRGDYSQASQALAAAQAVFNRDTLLGYSTTDITGLPRFMRWWPTGGGHLEEDAAVHGGKDVWKAVLEAEVWSVRAAGSGTPPANAPPGAIVVGPPGPVGPAGPQGPVGPAGPAGNGQGAITVDSAVVGGTTTLDLSTSNRHEVAMGAGNTTLALMNVGVGQVFMVRIKQDGVGSRTVTWFSGVSWPGASVPTLTTTAGKADAFIFYCRNVGVYDGFTLGLSI